MDPVLVVSLALGGVGAAGVVYAWFRQSMAKTTLELYQVDNDALRGRNETLESERDDLRSKVEDLVAKIAALRREVDVLRDLATGTSAVRDLADHLDRRLDEISSLLRKITVDRRGGDGDGG